MLYHILIILLIQKVNLLRRIYTQTKRGHPLRPPYVDLRLSVVKGNKISRRGFYMK